MNEKQIEEKKYELIEDDTIVVDGKTLHRIRALKDILFYDESIGADVNVHAGDFGGYIESERNLSHDGKAWVYDDSYVYEDAEVYGNARVRKKSRIYGYSSIGGDAVVDQSHVYDYADIFGDAVVYESNISQSTEIYGKANITNSFIYGKIQIYGSAHLHDVSFTKKGSIYGRVQLSHVKLYGDNVEICGNSCIIHAVINKDIFMSTGDICFCHELGIFNDIIINEASDFVYMENIGGYSIIMFYVSKDSKICFDAYMYWEADAFLRKPDHRKSGTIKDLLKKRSYCRGFIITIPC